MHQEQEQNMSDPNPNTATKNIIEDDTSNEQLQDSTICPQCSNNVLEVLCSGECTAGKLVTVDHTKTH